MMTLRNPLLFTPLPVTIITTIVYLTLAIALLVVHETVPSAPKNPVPFSGVNTTEAWLELQDLTNGFHPYNSRRNDEVRDWLLRRIEAILDGNGATYSAVAATGRAIPLTADEGDKASRVVIFNDMVSNVTFSSRGLITSSGQKRRTGQSVYFEGTNIIVYIRGLQDDDSDWWAIQN